MLVLSYLLNKNDERERERERQGEREIYELCVSEVFMDGGEVFNGWWKIMANCVNLMNVFVKYF